MGRLAFVGSKALGHRVLRVLLDEVGPADVLAGVLCPDDRDDARSALPAFQRTARVRGVPLAVASDRSAAWEALTAFSPDVAIVCGWYEVVPLRLFPRTAFYGLHASPLPRYRGGAPIVWQIINGEDRIGLSLFRLAWRLDAGDIVDQGTVPLEPLETVADALARIEDLAVRLVRANLRDILAGTARQVPQDEAAATTFPQRRPADGLIDWSLPAKRVHDHIRAQSAPYPGAFTRQADGRVVRVWRSAPLATQGQPGLVVADDEGVAVGCGEGSVRILSASFDGEPARAPAAILGRGQQLVPRGAVPSTAA